MTSPGFHTTRPPANPSGGSLGVDDITLQRDNISSATSGVFALAWARVKQKPAETLMLAMLSLLFSECTGASGGLSTSGSGGGEQAASGLGEGLSQLNLQAASELPELLAIMGIGAFVFMLAIALVVILKTLGALVAGVASSYWLSLLRDQRPTFGASDLLKEIVVKLVVTCLMRAALLYLLFALSVVPVCGLVYLGLDVNNEQILFGVLMLWALLVVAILGYIYSGLAFVEHVIVDKNLGYLQALRASWRVSAGHRFAILLVLITSRLLNVVGTMCCCVGLIPAQAIGMGAIAATYNHLAEPGNFYLPPSHHDDIDVGPTADIFN